MYRYSHQVRQTMAHYRLKNTVIAIILVIAVIGCIVFSSMYASANTYRSHSRNQINHRIMSDLTNARTLAERLTSSVQSNTAATLAQIRQYVYAMDQLNTIAITLDGEAGRIIPADAIDALFRRESLTVVKKTKNGPVDQDIVPMIRQLETTLVDANTLRLDCLICCQNPTLNPAQMVAALEKYMPELSPDHARYCRNEIYTTNEKVFR